jgi:lipid-A-disaccharide synthase
VRFVGHPFADAIPDELDSAAARRTLGLPEQGEIVALLPGSREGEVRRLAPVFIAAARWLVERRPGVRFAVPLVNESTRELFARTLAAVPGGPPCHLYTGRSREVMASADVVMLASGTATLEAMLIKRPMVAAYRLAPLTYWIVRRLLQVPYVTLPNLLAGETLVPELLQQEVTAENLGRAVLDYLEHPGKAAQLRSRFGDIHRMLRRQASERAAEAVLDLLARRRKAVPAAGCTL